MQKSVAGSFIHNHRKLETAQTSTQGSTAAPPFFAALGMQGGQHAQGGSHHRRHKVKGTFGATGRMLPSDQQALQKKGLPGLRLVSASLLS